MTALRWNPTETGEVVLAVKGQLRSPGATLSSEGAVTETNMFPISRIGFGQKMQLRREYVAGNPSPDSMLLPGGGATAPHSPQ